MKHIMITILLALAALPVCAQTDEQPATTTSVPERSKDKSTVRTDRKSNKETKVRGARRARGPVREGNLKQEHKDKNKQRKKEFKHHHQSPPARTTHGESLKRNQE